MPPTAETLFSQFGPSVNEANHVGFTMINTKHRVFKGLETVYHIRVDNTLLLEHVGKAKKKTKNKN